MAGLPELSEWEERRLAGVGPDVYFHLGEQAKTTETSTPDDLHRQRQRTASRELAEWTEEGLNLLNLDQPDWNNPEQTKFEHVVDLVNLPTDTVMSATGRWTRRSKRVESDASQSASGRTGRADFITENLTVRDRGRKRQRANR